MKTKIFCLFLILFSLQASSFSSDDKLKDDSKLIENELYQTLNLYELGLNENVFDKAIIGLNNLVHNGKIVNGKTVSIIDFSQSSNLKRLYIIDLENRKVLFNTYVAHGRNSGDEYATQFSNEENSFQSSLGFYITDEVYTGSHGTSLRLKGIEKGINDGAEHRGIVIHGAKYVASDFIRINGRLGRSLGCPAVSEELCLPIINTTKNGTCVFIYHPNSSYLNKSLLIN